MKRNLKTLVFGFVALVLLSISVPQNTLGTENEKEEFERDAISLRASNHDEVNVENPKISKTRYDKLINKAKVFTYMVATGVVAWGIYSYFYPITMNKQYLCKDPNYLNWFEDACKWVGGVTIFNNHGLPGNMIGDNTWWHEWIGWPTCACVDSTSLFLGIPIPALD